MPSERVQRRLAAILAADIVGYSRLMEADEAGTLARVKALRAEFLHPKVAAYGGRIVKTTGDGTLIEFPSAVDAVQHAVDVQREMLARGAGLPESQRIVLRMGINLGDIIIDGEDIYGDGVNIAARLEALADPGGICISGTVHEHVRNKLDATFEDIGAQTLKNIAKPVQVYRVKVDWQVDAKGATPPLPLPERPSIAVLPFANMSGDPEQEYFADGIAEDIITALSRFRWFFVIARNSSFIYKGRSVDVRQIGRELGVRYVLEGSVRKGGNRLRITAQLVDAATSNHLWAEKYDGAPDEIFELQDRITEGVIAAVEPSVRRAEIERARRKRPDNLDAYDLYLRALVHFWAFVPAEWLKAVDLLDRSLEIDPSYIEARGLAAICNALLAIHGSESHKPAAMRHAHTVVASNSDDATAYAYAGRALNVMAIDLKTGRAALDRALALNPNSSQALAYSAAANSFIGQLEEAVDQAQRSIRLNPFDPEGFIALVALSRAHFLLGRYPEAAAAAAKGVQATPNSIYSYIWLAASNLRLGRVDEARAAAQRLLEIDPTFRCGVWTGIMNSPPAHKEAVVSALREAGIPE